MALLFSAWLSFVKQILKKVLDHFHFKASKSYQDFLWDIKRNNSLIPLCTHLKSMKSLIIFLCIPDRKFPTWWPTCANQAHDSTCISTDTDQLLKTIYTAYQQRNEVEKFSGPYQRTKPARYEHFLVNVIAQDIYLL